MLDTGINVSKRQVKFNVNLEILDRQKSIINAEKNLFLRTLPNVLLAVHNPANIRHCSTDKRSFRS